MTERILNSKVGCLFPVDRHRWTFSFSFRIKILGKRKWSNSRFFNIRSHRTYWTSCCCKNNSRWSICQRYENFQINFKLIKKRFFLVFYGFIFFSLQIALCAYLVTIAKTSRNLLCGSMSCAAENFTEIMDETEGRLCLDYGLDERTVYILILILFVTLSTPLLAMNITNNTFVQYLGTILRWMTILG